MKNFMKEKFYEELMAQRGKNTEEESLQNFETDVNHDNVSYFLSKLTPVDREKFKKMLERMSIVNKYELLAKRSSYVDC